MEDIIKVLLYPGYFTEANCKYFNKIFVCYFYIITKPIVSDNRESEVMLYFTDEVFRHLANQNRGHIRVMLEYLYFTETFLID